MKIFVGQIYTKAGVSFPFSIRFQRWLSDALSEHVEGSSQFFQRFGQCFVVGLRLSAKEGIELPEIKGPTIFKRDERVEFTIFLPFRQGDYREATEAWPLVEQFLQATVEVLTRLDLDPAQLVSDVTALRAEFLETPELLIAQTKAIT